MTTPFYPSIYHFSRGRVALYAILRAMGIGMGDEVIVQGFTCLAVPLPVILVGAKPVYADIDGSTYNMDLEKVESLITRLTKAIIVQYTYGIPLDMERLMALARKHNLFVIEDCCHSSTSECNGRKVGTFGDAAFFSYEWGKPLIIGTGGSAILNSQTLAEKVAHIYEDSEEPGSIDVLKIRIQYIAHSLLRRPVFFWWIRRLYRLMVRFNMTPGSFSRGELKGKVVPFGSVRMSGYHQKKLAHEMKKMEQDRELRLKLVTVYEKELAIIGVKTMSLSPDWNVSYLRYPLLVKNKQYVLEQAMRRKIEIGNWFNSPVHPWLEEHWKSVDYQKGSCPVAETVASRIITLPIYSKIKEKDIERMFSFLDDMKKAGELA
jgi:dTDP-4-amino-4,6-dideoxygalactose transaminase